MDTIDCVIWFARMVLPIVFFLVYLRISQDDQDPRTYCRVELLEHRYYVRKSDGKQPVVLNSMRMCTEDENPEFFKKATELPMRRRDRRKLARGEEMVDIGGQPSNPRFNEMGKNMIDEMFQLESLVNYMAFSNAHQRIFLPPGDPKAPLQPESPPQVSEAAAEKANEEVCSVLRGALQYKRMDVVTDLIQQLRDNGVAIMEQTFRLVIEVAVESGNPQEASDYLVQMEEAGYLDQLFRERVMKNTQTRSPELKDGAHNVIECQKRTTSESGISPRAAPRMNEGMRAVASF